MGEKCKYWFTGREVGERRLDRINVVYSILKQCADLVCIAIRVEFVESI